MRTMEWLLDNEVVQKKMERMSGDKLQRYKTHLQQYANNSKAYDYIFEKLEEGERNESLHYIESVLQQRSVQLEKELGIFINDIGKRGSEKRIRI